MDGSRLEQLLSHLVVPSIVLVVISLGDSTLAPFWLGHASAG
jgi:hypothetical protein